MGEPLNPDTVIADASAREERAVVAMEYLAAALLRCATVMEKRYHQEYPEKGNVRDATVTRIPTDEDRIRESLHGDTSQPIDQWTSLGPAEKRFEEKQNRPKQDSKGTATAAKRTSPDAPEGDSGTD